MGIGGFIRVAVAALCALVGLFLLGAAAGAPSWGLAVGGLTLLLTGAAVLAVSAAMRAETYVAASGRIVGLPGERRADVVVELPPFEPVRTTVALPVHARPAVGETLPMLIPLAAPRRMFAAADIGPAFVYSGAFRRLRRRRSRTITKWPSIVWLDDALEPGREWLSGWMLGWQRRYCERILDDLLQAPENLSLRAITGTGDQVVRREALDDQEYIFDATAGLRRRTVRPLAATFALLMVAAYLLVAVFFRLGDSLANVLTGEEVADQWHWAEAVRASRLPRADLYALLGCAAVLAVAAIRFAQRTVGATRGALRDWRAELRSLVNQELRDAYQQLINAPQAPTLQVRTAPGLATAAADQLIERTEGARLRALAFDLGAGAIAVSGMRGVGKSTVLNVLTGPDTPAADPDAFKIMVAAPVQYDAREFLLHLYAELCKAVLRVVGPAPRRSVPAWLRTRARGILSTLLLALAWAVVVMLLEPARFDWLRGRVELPELNGTILVLAWTLFLLSGWVDTPQPPEHRWLAIEAERRLRQTRFLQTLSVEQHGQLGRGGIELGRRRSRQLAELPLSLPEIVQGYREFASQVAEWWSQRRGGSGKLLIGIDEVDRIADPDLAERFVNEIKAIFGVRHCVCLVSISEEALANFERRVVRMRTVFDSAFDHVVRLRPLTLEESLRLLRLRLTGVPDRFLVLCHCLAGGMPREVLRTARAMFDRHRESAGPSSLSDIAGQLVAAEVQVVKRGFLSQLTSAALDDSSRALAGLLADPEWPELTGPALSQAVERDISADDEPAASLAAALLFYATVLELFTSRQDIVDEWVDQLDEPPSPEASDEAPPAVAASLADALATLHRTLPLNASLAIRQLAQIRLALGLPEVRVAQAPAAHTAATVPAGTG